MNKSICSAPLRPGTRVGSFKIDKLISCGAFGEVYQAHKEKKCGLYALKIVRNMCFNVLKQSESYQSKVELEVLVAATK